MENYTMPLPFILAGAAIAAGGFGVKKGLDAKSDFDTAKKMNKNAEELYGSAVANLEDNRERAKDAMERLGKTKFNTYQESLIPFVETFSKIKNINFKDNKLVDIDKLPSLTKDELNEMTESTLEIREMLSGGIISLGTGGLVGLATYGGVGVLGTASTTAAISGLSGVAATNATLAWFGGGSLAAGGYGMAGGAVVLGGIVAGPVLAVGGMMLASKAEAAKEDAYANYSKANLAAEEMESAATVTVGIRSRFNEMDVIVEKLDRTFKPMLESLKSLVASNNNYASYTEEDKKGVMMAASTALSLKNLLESPILNEDGALTNTSSDAITLANDAYEKLN